jgi:hypothetical protein
MRRRSRLWQHWWRRCAIRGSSSPLGMWLDSGPMTVRTEDDIQLKVKLCAQYGEPYVDILEIL